MKIISIQEGWNKNGTTWYWRLAPHWAQAIGRHTSQGQEKYFIAPSQQVWWMRGACRAGWINVIFILLILSYRLSQPRLSVTCAAVKRMQETTTFNPSDFDILLIPPSENQNVYQLPESLIHIGEDGDLAAQRTLRDSAEIVGMRYFRARLVWLC